MQRNVMRTKAGRFCQIEIRLEDKEDPSNQGPHLRLSICGSYGRIVKRKLAKTEAIQYWTSFFEDSPEERHAMNDRFGRNFRTARSAAKFVLESDGEFHGLDVIREQNNAVYLLEGGGQCTSELAEWFPECVPYLKWHLNDMKAGCEHQDALGWGHGRTVALSRADATQAQLDVLDGAAMARCAKVRETAFQAKWAALQLNELEATKWIKAHNDGACTVHDRECLMTLGPSYTAMGNATLRKFDRWLKADIEREIQPELFEAEIFKDSIGAPCPTCGYRYGTAWLVRPLPPEVIEWARTFGAEESDHV